MSTSKWTPTSIQSWVDEQSSNYGWYQSILLPGGIVTPGATDSIKRLDLLNLPSDLKGKSVLDVGCNSGMLCFEAKRRNAGRVVGVDLMCERLAQARVIAQMLGFEIDFMERSLFDAASLGKFDFVFCIAVLTEVTDLIGGLQVLKAVTGGSLFLELALMNSDSPSRKFECKNRILELSLRRIFRRSMNIRTPLDSEHGTANLRRVKSSRVDLWTLSPNRRFVESILGPQFAVEVLGPSVRYTLLKITRCSCPP